ncbi:MAG: hypothetical protein LBL83_11355 [Clostridiales bacterium]|jgi:hypothetical protein|nr:hypothetical protein [Clostridiales bacterium]
MPKNYAVKDTTKVQREKYANEAMSIAILAAPEPSKFAQDCMREYIDGRRELSDVRQQIISHYRVADNA